MRVYDLPSTVERKDAQRHSTICSPFRSPQLQPITKGILHEEYLAEIVEELRASADQHGEGLHASHNWPRISGAQLERTADAYPRHYNRTIGGKLSTQSLLIGLAIAAAFLLGHLNGSRASAVYKLLSEIELFKHGVRGFVGLLLAFVSAPFARCGDKFHDPSLDVVLR